MCHFAVKDSMHECFRIVKKYIDSCLNDSCRCDINSDLLEAVHNISTRHDLDCAQKTIAFKLMSAYSKKVFSCTNIFFSAFYGSSVG